MTRKALIVPVVAVIVCLSAASGGFAAIYKYTDKQGIIGFADDLQSIPKEYRASALLVSGEREGDEKTAARKTASKSTPSAQPAPAEVSSSPAADLEQSPIDNIKKSFFINRLLISALVIVSAVFAFSLIRIFDAEHKKRVKIARLVILWGLSVYLIIAHVGDVMSLFRSANVEIDMIKRDSAKKGKKAAKALKEINALIQDAEKAASHDSDSAAPEKRD